MHRTRGLSGAVVGLLLGLVFVRPLWAAEIRVGEEYGAQVAWTEVEGCRVSLDRNMKWRTLHYRNLCAEPLADKLAHFAQLLDAVNAGGPLPAEVRSLFLGRLVDYPDLVVGIVLAAQAAPDWDATRGEVRRKLTPLGINRYFARLLEESGLLGPFLAPLAPSGVAAAHVSVEKVLIGPPTLTPVADRLRAAGVAAEARLPFDAMVWLTFERAGARAK